MTKIIWALIGINTTALLIFVAAYFILTNGRHVDYQEKGWTIILAGLGLVVIVLAVLPLYYGWSAGWRIFSGFFAVLPLLIFLISVGSKKLSSLKRKRTFAETYYKDKKQRRIAAAIESNDTTLLKELIKGEDLNIQGNRVWDVDGLNYLQFAIRLRSNSISFPFDEEANMAAIRILIANGSLTTPALAEATHYLPPVKLLLLLNAGADPNCPGFVNLNPLLFEVIGKHTLNDIAVLLIQKGADVNAKMDGKYTPVMWAAWRADTNDEWSDTWRLVRYLLEKANADYTYTAKDGTSLMNIIENIKTKAGDQKIIMPADFDTVVNWLAQHTAAKAAHVDL